MRLVYPLTREHAVVVNGSLCAGGQRVVVDVGRRALFALEVVCAYMYTIIPFQNAVKRDRDWCSDKSKTRRDKVEEEGGWSGDWCRQQCARVGGWAGARVEGGKLEGELGPQADKAAEWKSRDSLQPQSSQAPSGNAAPGSGKSASSVGLTACGHGLRASMAVRLALFANSSGWLAGVCSQEMRP